MFLCSSIVWYVFRIPKHFTFQTPQFPGELFLPYISCGCVLDTPIGWGETKLSWQRSVLYVPLRSDTACAALHWPKLSGNDSIIEHMHIFISTSKFWRVLDASNCKWSACVFIYTPTCFVGRKNNNLRSSRFLSTYYKHGIVFRAQRIKQAFCYSRDAKFRICADVNTDWYGIYTGVQSFSSFGVWYVVKSCNFFPWSGFYCSGRDALIKFWKNDLKSLFDIKAGVTKRSRLSWIDNYFFW